MINEQIIIKNKVFIIAFLNQAISRTHIKASTDDLILFFNYLMIRNDIDYKLKKEELDSIINDHFYKENAMNVMVYSSVYGYACNPERIVFNNYDYKYINIIIEDIYEIYLKNRSDIINELKIYYNIVDLEGWFL